MHKNLIYFIEGQKRNPQKVWSMNPLFKKHFSYRITTCFFNYLTRSFAFFKLKNKNLNKFLNLKNEKKNWTKVYYFTSKFLY